MDTMWEGINKKSLATLVLAVGALAAWCHWLIAPESGPIGLWGYVGTAALGVVVALAILDKWLWKVKVGNTRLFGWICRKPDISGRWVLSMQPTWKDSEPFDQSL